MWLALFSCLFFLSGIAALLFQTLWLRLSGLVFGNSVWSVALILSSFMAGLALGNFLAFTRKIPRLQPLRLYAWLELFVGLGGCALVFILPGLGHGLRPLFQSLGNAEGALNVLRFAISFLVLLAPSTAMGLTFPVLTADSRLRDAAFGRAAGVLYGSNTLGAVGGALFGEFFLFEKFGLLGTAFFAGSLSLLAALFAWGMSRTDLPETVADASISDKTTRGNRPALPWRLLTASFGSGALLLALEVIWFRFLRLYFVSSPAAFALMLAVVLLAIGIGGLLSGWLGRFLEKHPASAAALLLLAGASVLPGYLFFPVPAHVGANGENVRSWLEITRLSLALIFPTAVLSGMLFPVLATRIQRKFPDRLASLGLATFCNTLGAALGPLVVVFLLLPRFGMQVALIVCAIIYAVLAALVGPGSIWSWRRVSGIPLALLLAAFLGLLFWFPADRDQRHFANARHFYEADGSRPVRTIEGTSDTFQLLRKTIFGGTYYYRLVTNDFSMSSTHPLSQRYMKLFAYLPLALRPASTDVLQICYGIGVTAEALTKDTQLTHLDFVDISREVFDLAPIYAGRRNPLLDRRATVHVQDGRFFLQTTPRFYDVITAEPPPLKVSGTVNLYTEEFFQLLRSRLKPGGIASIWLPIYQTSPAETKAILSAFHGAFPNASVWGGADQEWIMLGINGPAEPIEAKSVGNLWESLGTQFDLQSIGQETPLQIPALFLMDGAEISRLTAGVAPLQDNFPKRLGDAAPDPAAVAKFAWPYLEAARAEKAFAASDLIRQLWPEGFGDALSPLFVIREARYLSQTQGGNWLAELDLYLRHSSLRTPVLDVLQSDLLRIQLARQLASRTHTIPREARNDLVAAVLARRDLKAAIDILEAARLAQSATLNELYLLTYLNCLSGNVGRAEMVAASFKTPKDWFTEWLWNDLKSDFGFVPPE